MFYLNHFYKSVLKSGSKGGFFVLFTFLLLVGYPQRSFFEGHLSMSLKSQLPSPYFYALLSVPDEVNNIRGKMASLPGVLEVRLIEKSDLENEVKNLMGDTWKETPEILDLNYVGLKIVYENQISESARKIIRDYLVKFVGEEKVVLGPIKRDDNPETRESGWYYILKKFGLFPLFLIFIIFWVLALNAFGTTIRETAYLIEQYQRRKSVPWKLLLSGELILIATSLPVAYFWGDFAEISYILIVALIIGVSFMFVRSPKWSDR